MVTKNSDQQGACAAVQHNEASRQRRFFHYRVSVCLIMAMLLGSCVMQQQNPVATIYPETQQPYFKTCIARNGGSYRERALYTYNIQDIYQNSAPDMGPITEECILRE
ncbi:MAG: hypothetical protein P8M73_08590 [Luminiphilus sp.]|nr:hypothetical protein [Luminiphilus sp.]